MFSKILDFLLVSGPFRLLLGALLSCLYFTLSPMFRLYDIFLRLLASFWTSYQLQCCLICTFWFPPMFIFQTIVSCSVVCTLAFVSFLRYFSLTFCSFLDVLDSYCYHVRTLNLHFVPFLRYFPLAFNSILALSNFYQLPVTLTVPLLCPTFGSYDIFPSLVLN